MNASQGFVDGVATRDLVINPQTGIWARIYLPETSTEMGQVEKYPILLHFHGGGFVLEVLLREVQMHFSVDL